MQQSPAQIYDQFNRSVPLEIGHDRRLSGTPATRLTTPIPPMNIYTGMISQSSMESSFDSVVTKSMLPYPQSQQLITTQLQGPATPAQVEVPKSTPKAKVTCAGPNNLCYDELNQLLFDLLRDSQSDTGCIQDDSEVYGATDLKQGEFKWQYPEELLCRGQSGQPFVATRDIIINYARWQPEVSSSNTPKSSEKKDSAENEITNPVRILLLHDALDCRKSWICAQKLLAPFIDSIAVDLLGSGESSKPRGLNRAGKGGDSAADFPWSYETHAQYLLSMTEFFWPEDKFFIAGVGWGAQIAAVMATVNPTSVAGIIMINPVNFNRDIHPELAYSSIMQFSNVQTEKQLQESHVSYIGTIRSALIESLGSAGSGVSDGKRGETFGKLESLLKQYAELDRRMVLVEQLIRMAESSLMEFPRTTENPDGLEYDKIGCSVNIISSGDDSIYGSAHRNFYPSLYYNASVNIHYLGNGGHLVNLTQPEVVAEIIMEAVRNNAGFTSLKNPFVGFRSGGTIDKSALVEGFKSIYGM